MKKYLLGLFAIVLAVGFSAFTTKSTTTLGEKYWFDATNGYAFLGFATVVDAEQNLFPGCITTGTVRCAVGYDESRHDDIDNPFDLIMDGEEVIGAEINLVSNQPVLQTSDSKYYVQE